jgi:Family of unknown function (DUF6304)
MIGRSVANKGKEEAVQTLSFPGSYEDGTGFEEITWWIRSSSRDGYSGRYEISSWIRGVEIWGVDFDGLEPVDQSRAGAHDRLTLNSAGELGACVLTGDMPCVAIVAEQQVPIVVRFGFDLRVQPRRHWQPLRNLRLSTVIDGSSHVVVDDWFEDAALGLDLAVRPHRLKCCVTSLHYSPGGHGLMGMRCHRDAKEQYLIFKSKWDYWSVPVTEDVPETYLCEEYQLRIPGTGYRG